MKIAKKLLEKIQTSLTLGKRGLYYVVPGVNWSLDWDGYYITNEVSEQFGLQAKVATRPPTTRNQIIHYGSLWDLAASIGTKPNKKNIVVGTIFHGQKEAPEFQEAFLRVLRGLEEISTIHTSCSIMRERLASWGVPDQKLVQIPLGVDPRYFYAAAEEEKRSLKAALDIPEGAICIGSFHKDGVGMGEGMEPKPIKGPDILVEVLKRVSMHHPIFVLLSAPARGYVKKRLVEAGIPFKHIVLQDYLKVAELYRAIDMYLLTSREEGGPKGLLEAMASGVPVVATRVGLVPDVVSHELNGLIANIEDVDGLAEHCLALIGDKRLASRLVKNASATIREYSWDKIASQYYRNLYAPLLSR